MTDHLLKKAQELLNVEIMRLTVTEDSYQKVSLKQHHKHLRRLKELRLAAVLPLGYLKDLDLFTGLRLLYLDRGTDTLTTLAEISKHIKAPLPLQVVLGYSAIVPRPLFAERPEIYAASIPVESTTLPLRIELANQLNLKLACREHLLDFLEWPNLETLRVDLDIGAKIVQAIPSPKLRDLTLHFENTCTFFGRTGHLLHGIWSAEHSQFLGMNKISLAGNLSGFQELLVLVPTTFHGLPLPSIRSLSVTYAPHTPKQLEIYLSMTPLVQKLHVTLVEGVDYVLIVRNFPSIKEIDFHLLGPESKTLAETTAALLKPLGCKTIASVSGGRFITIEYDSDKGVWEEYCDR